MILLRTTSFLIYINDLPLALHKCNLTMYADDTSISYASKNIEELNTVINRDLDCLNKWLQGNKLSLNFVKTQVMVIGSQPNLKKIADEKVDTPSFSTGDSVIGLVKNVKYLGAQLDSNLDWNQHMKVLCSKVSRAIGFLKYAKKFVPKEILIHTYRGIVVPHFRYCCSVWGSCGETRLRALQKLQNRAARIVSNSRYDTSATLLIKNLKWLTVTDMIKSETATMTYKAITGLTPSYLANLFTKTTDRNIDINLRNTANDLYIHRMTTSKGQKAISYRGDKAWNQLSLDIKEANSLNSFKCKLKHHLQPTV